MWGRLKSKVHKLNYIKYIIKVGDNVKVHESYVKLNLKWKVRLTRLWTKRLENHFGYNLGFEGKLIQVQFKQGQDWVQGTLGFAQVRVEVKFKVQVKK